MTVALSIVIPIYNMADLIGDVLSALKTQTFSATNFEIVLVDDGSTDASSSVAQATATKLGMDNLRVVSQTNAGPGAARNRGIHEASAPIVVFLDSDCIPEPTWLEEMFGPFIEDPSLAGVEGKTIPSGEVTSVFDHYIDNPKGGNCWTCNIAYRKNWLIEAGGLDENLRWCEDIDIAYRMKQFGEIRFNPAAVVSHLVIRWPFKTHFGMVHHFPYLIYTWRKNPGTILPTNSNFMHLMAFQFKSTLWIPINQRRWAFRRPLEYLLICFMVFCWLIYTLLLTPYYYVLSRRPIRPREPFENIAYPYPEDTNPA